MRRERLAQSQLSKRLQEAEANELGDIDVVRAMGMAAQGDAMVDLGLSLWRVKYSGVHRELRGLAMQLMALMEQHQRDVEQVAPVLAYWLDGVCKTCSGLGYDVIPGTPTLSDVACGSCEGTGQQRFEGPRDADWLLEVIAGAERRMASAVMQRLADDMDYIFDAGRDAYSPDGG